MMPSALWDQEDQEERKRKEQRRKQAECERAGNCGKKGARDKN
jgi:hypothetical protein